MSATQLRSAGVKFGALRDAVGLGGLFAGAALNGAVGGAAAGVSQGASGAATGAAYTIEQLLKLGVDVRELKVAGASPKAMRGAGVADTVMVDAGYDPDEVVKLGPTTNLDNGGLSTAKGATGVKPKGGVSPNKKKTVPYPLKDYAALIAALSDVTMDESVSFHVKALEKCVVRCQVRGKGGRVVKTEWPPPTRVCVRPPPPPTTNHRHPPWPNRSTTPTRSMRRRARLRSSRIRSTRLTRP